MAYGKSKVRSIGAEEEKKRQQNLPPSISTNNCRKQEKGDHGSRLMGATRAEYESNVATYY
jgi:hypothetical protein